MKVCSTFWPSCHEKLDLIPDRFISRDSVNRSQGTQGHAITSLETVYDVTMEGLEPTSLQRKHSPEPWPPQK